MDLIDVSPQVAIAALAGVVGVFLLAFVFFVRSAPPSTLTISSGPEGSVFFKNAQKYAKILEKNGVKLNVLASNGSLENLRRLTDPNGRVDLAIVQAGISGVITDNLISLGSLSHQPLFLFYRGPEIELISQLAGKRVAVGTKGSGTHAFAQALLEPNGIKSGGSTTLLELDAEDAHKALLEGRADAAFMMSESASPETLKALFHSSEIRLYDYKQATAFSRKIDYLNVMDLPMGGFDFALNIPSRDTALLGPMVELIAVKSLHPALSDLILEAAMEVHGRPGLFQRRGEFPAPIEHGIKLSEDSTRFFKSGKSFLYRYMPFWLASLLSRIFVVFLPTLVVIIPILKSIPAFFRWRTQRRIHLRYRELLALEDELNMGDEARDQEKIRAKFDLIEDAVNRMKIPPSFADQFYGLRGHIEFVRQLMMKAS
jgi:hypothetical protein